MFLCIQGLPLQTHFGFDIKWSMCSGLILYNSPQCDTLKEDVEDFGCFVCVTSPFQLVKMLAVVSFLGFVALHVLSISIASALPATNTVLAAPPAVFTPNPKIGDGGSHYKDSAHFRIYGASDSVADSAIRMLEAAHTCFVEGIGWRSPGLSFRTLNNDGPWYKLNVYQVADGALPGAAAQTWTDHNAGFSFLKVVNKYMTEPGVVVHEFGHAMTYSEKNWVDQTRTGAWWETIANFIADTYISTPVCDKAKQAYNLPTSGGNSLIEVKKVIGDAHQVIVDGTANSGNYYQAWPFLAYITNNPDGYPGLGNQTLLNMIRKYNLNSNETPLHSLARLLGASAPIQKVVGRYWARMAYVDIGHPKAQAVFNSQRSSINFSNLDSNGNGRYTVKSARQPRYFGANIIPLKGITAETIGVTVTAGAPYTATLVVKRAGGAFQYTELDGGKGSVSVAAGEEASLVVANTPSQLIQFDPFSLTAEANKGLSYQVQLTGATA